MPGNFENFGIYLKDSFSNNPSGEPMRHVSLFLTVILLPLLLGVLSCSPKETQPTGTANRNETNWPVSTPEAQGMDSMLLIEMLEEIQGQNLGINSIQIVRNGVLVLDTYIPPFKKGDRHNIYSCTKSVMSILIGIALDQGHIESLDQRVLDFFPERKVENLSAEKEKLTLRHLLTMSTGLDSRDSYLYNWSGLSRMKTSGDWVGHILDLSMTAEPGSRFDYSNMASHLLSAIITETTGKSALTFGRENLFGPLGIIDIEWPSDSPGSGLGRAEMRMKPLYSGENNIGWAEMELRAPDLAKIGQLVLNEGRWEGQTIISPDYLKAATSPQIRAGTLQNHYGFQWWIKEPGLFMALGYGGQYLIVFPEESLVVVFTSALAVGDFYYPDILFSTFIRPALLSKDPLPENNDVLSVTVQ
jgi:CubicO group peptidase (beta-lactamase class C family)